MFLLRRTDLGDFWQFWALLIKTPFGDLGFWLRQIEGRGGVSLGGAEFMVI